MQKIKTVSQDCIKLIEKHECSGNVNQAKFLNAYLCPAGVWTIGIGTTLYPDGSKVKKGDKCTVDQAYDYLRSEVSQSEKYVDAMCVDTITQAQFDSLVSFVYNVGVGNFKTSSLLKKINTNPNDPEIRKCFMMWVYGGDGTTNGVDDDGDGMVDEAGERKKLAGLVTRRKDEADLYFKK